MSTKTNQDKIKEYLVGDKGYLKDSLSNGKVIMLSGKWGSGKTHFWQYEIATDELKKELKKKREVYSYISLYGKSSIEEIENDIFSQAYSSAIGGENFITKGFSTFTKRMKRFGSSKLANALKDEQQDNIERTALSRLNNGGIICFDDFERKSKNIDLNDLFGFITQLTLNFECKVVIILNDDVFEGEEKKIFTNVKEKTVSKFLYYNPTIEELFNLIFKKESEKSGEEIGKYIILKKFRKIILEIITETEELNARIYIQVLDNILEWVNNNKSTNKKYINFLILNNINFILYHHIFKVVFSSGERSKYNAKTGSIEIKKIDKKLYLEVKTVLSIPKKIKKYIAECENDNILNCLYNKIPPLENKNSKTSNNTDDSDVLVEFIKTNQSYVKSEHFKNKHDHLIKFDSHNEAEKELLNAISNFIETGILIK